MCNGCHEVESTFPLCKLQNIDTDGKYTELQDHKYRPLAGGTLEYYISASRCIQSHSCLFLPSLMELWFYEPSHIPFTGSANVSQMSPFIYSLKYIHFMAFVVNLLKCSCVIKTIKTPLKHIKIKILCHMFRPYWVILRQRIYWK
jgi:hypothetical protein